MTHFILHASITPSLYFDDSAYILTADLITWATGENPQLFQVFGYQGVF